MPEELKLLPCPACGGKAVFPINFEDVLIQIECGCGCSGHRELTEEKAITAWNSLPRALTWTTEPPKKVGWYFWRSDTFQGNGYESTAYVDDTKAILELLLTNKHKNIRFAGPIPMPKEPTP